MPADATRPNHSAHQRDIAQALHLDTTVADLARDARRARCHSVVLSAEWWATSLRELSQGVGRIRANGHTATVIYTFRNQAERLNSHYSQRLKRSTVPVENLFLEIPVTDFNAFANALIDSTQLDVPTFDIDHEVTWLPYGPNIVDTFMAAIGVEELEWIPKKSNQSLNAAETLFWQRHHVLLRTKRFNRAKFLELSRAESARLNIAKPFWGISDELRHRIAARYDSDNHERIGPQLAAWGPEVVEQANRPVSLGALGDEFSDFERACLDWIHRRPSRP